MKMRRLSAGFAAFAVILSTAIGAAAPAFATTPNTCLWVGGTDTKFSTAANWSNCGSVAPQAGDIVSFNNVAAIGGGSNFTTLTDDLSVALGGLTIGTTSTNQGQMYTIPSITFAAGATLTDTQTPPPSSGAYPWVQLTLDAVTGQGDLTLAQTGGAGSEIFGGSGDWNVAGTLTLPTGYFSTPMGSVQANNTVVPNGGDLAQGTAAGATEAGSFTLGGGTTPNLTFWGGTSSAPNVYTLSGAIALQANSTICPVAYSTVNVTGAISGTGFALSKDTNTNDGCTGTVNINPSSNSSATVAGNFPGTNQVTGGQGSAPGYSVNTPDTTAGGPNISAFQSLTVDSSGNLNDWLAPSTSASQNVVIGVAPSGTGNYVPVVEAKFNLASANADLTGATIQTDASNHKALAHNVAQATLGHVYTLFVPANATDKYVGICPGAASMSVVAPGCVNGYYLTNGQTYNGVNAKLITIAGKSYWAVSGLTGTGAYSSAVVPPNTGFTDLSLGSALTPIVAAVLAAAGIAVAGKRFGTRTSKGRR